MIKFLSFSRFLCSVSSLKILKATRKNAPVLKEFLAKFYFSDEPLWSAMKCGNPDLNVSIRALPENYSVVAVENTGKIVGVILNHDTSIKPAHPVNYTSELRKYFGVDEIMNEIIGDSKFLSTELGAVDKAFRGKKIGVKMLEATEEMAKGFGFVGIFGKCANKYSAAMFESMSYEKIFSFPYSKFVDKNGEPRFTIPPPHTEYQGFLKRF